MPYLQKIQDIVKREAVASALIGTAGWAISKYVAGARGQVLAPVIRTPVDMNIVVGASIGVSNFVGAVLEDALEEYYPNNEYIEPVSMLVRPAINGLVTYQTMRMGVARNINVQIPFLAGAASTAIGQYANENLVGFENAF